MSETNKIHVFPNGDWAAEIESAPNDSIIIVHEFPGEVDKNGKVTFHSEESQPFTSLAEFGSPNHEALKDGELNIPEGVEMYVARSHGSSNPTFSGDFLLKPEGNNIIGSFNERFTFNNSTRRVYSNLENQQISILLEGDNIKVQSSSFGESVIQLPPVKLVV